MVRKAKFTDFIPMQVELREAKARIAALEAQLAERVKVPGYIIKGLRHAASNRSDRLQQTDAIDKAIAFLSALEATPPAPTVTDGTAGHDPKLGTTLHLMKQSWESRQPTNSGAPKVTEEMVKAAAKALAKCAWNRSNASDSNFMKMKYPGGEIQYIEEMWRAYSDDARAAITAAQEAGKP